MVYHKDTKVMYKDIDRFYRGSIKRDPDCPLVDLGKHGDLIDRDEVRNAVFHHLSIKGEENLLPAEKSVFGNIIKAKAVIEAEDGE